MNILRQAGFFALLTLAVDFVPLFMAAAYVLRPSEHRLALMRPLSLAGLFSGLAGGTVGMVNGFRAIAIRGEFPLGAAFAGFSEALVPVAMAFACLTAAWLLVAVGMGRQSAD